MASRQTVKRAVVVGSLALTALAAPTYAALTTPDALAPQAAGQCLAWFGSMKDGKCISYAMNNGAPNSILNGGGISVNGPNTGNGGLTTGPLFPGQTVNVPLG